VPVVLGLLAVAFAYSIGAHYTGACMGMPVALHALSGRSALLIMAPLALLGAALASHGVERTVGRHLLSGPGLSVTGLVVVVGTAFLLTSLFNRWRLPTSTIQILVFTMAGAGLGAGVGVHWPTVETLLVIWAAAPVVALASGYLLTRVLDRVPGMLPAEQPARPGPGDGAAPAGSRPLAAALVAVGALASFTMGGNDVANATGALVGSHTLGPYTAGLLGGAGLAAGVLLWGRPLLQRVAFDVVTVDRPMATAAQLVQAAVVLAAVGFGFFTSMNQALVGAMAGAGAARGRRTVHGRVVRGILGGWLVGPAAGLALGYAFTRLAAALAGLPALLPGH
jgi:PiT family inorganic phosphate transporter